jgi:hypothetical protein
LTCKRFRIRLPESSFIELKRLWRSLRYAIPFVVSNIVLNAFLQTNDWGALSRMSLRPPVFPVELIPPTETMAEHRAKSLSALLPITLATGFLETEPELEPLKVP